jgi:hypothetical protein
VAAEFDGEELPQPTTAANDTQIAANRNADTRITLLHPSR